MLAKCALHPWIRSSQRRLCTETHLARPFPSPLLLLRGNLMSILDKDEERFGGGPERVPMAALNLPPLPHPGAHHRVRGHARQGGPAQAAGTEGDPRRRQGRQERGVLPRRDPSTIGQEKGGREQGGHHRWCHGIEEGPKPL